ncbi:MAG: hypothetical protein V3T81_05455 [Thermoanaerobaculia bacterium]
MRASFLQPASADRRVTARAWCRVDLAGGTLDIWPLGLLHPGARTVNVAIDLEVRVEIRPSTSAYRVVQDGSVVEGRSAGEVARQAEGALIGLIVGELGLGPVEVRVRSASPRGGGLGASSALAVATIAAAEAFSQSPATTPHERSALARDLEAGLMGLPTGRQDHFPALLGGVLDVVHRPGGERVEQIDVDLVALGESLVVAYTGQSHFSAANNWRVIRRRLDGDPEIILLFDGIRDVARRLRESMVAGDFESVGRLMSEEWGLRRQLAAGVSTPTIEQLLEVGRAAGAWGGKACGAGGGGSIAVLCPADRRQEVVERLAAHGAELLSARPAAGPLSVEIEGGRS